MSARRTGNSGFCNTKRRERYDSDERVTHFTRGVDCEEGTPHSIPQSRTKCCFDVVTCVRNNDFLPINVECVAATCNWNMSFSKYIYLFGMYVSSFVF